MDTEKMILVCGKEDVVNVFPERHERMNKGDAGRVLCVCGSYDESGAGMCGAAYFAAMAAYRCGAGIVEIFTARENYASLGALVPEAIFSLYGSDESRSDVCARLKERIGKADSVVIGCGLGKSDMSKSIVKTTLGAVDAPMVIDADALNIMSETEDLWSLLSREQRARTVITPHPGEMSRICKKSISEILSGVKKTAYDVAKAKGIVCLLKDHRTVITDGTCTFVNHSGNAGMATGGSGDVLAGIIGALLARDSVADFADRQRMTQNPILYRAAVGAYVHGLAGDAAASKIGEYSMIASDILHEIAGVIAQNKS